MKKYLSIGEVSKIKGVSVKSLRYYGELGILPPIYINKETGYRYYSMEQLVIVDLIVVCLDLGIPLKNFREYITENQSIDVEKLLADGEHIVSEKVKKLKSSIDFLNTMSKHITRTSKVKDNTEEFAQHIPKRYFLTADWNGDLTDYREISTKYTELFRQCNKLNMPDTFNQGVFFEKQNEKIISKVFLEIPCPSSDITNLHIVEEGNFICRVLKDDELSAHLDDDFKGIFIIKELFDLKIEPQVGLLEIQKYAKDNNYT
ncbi:MerR family transcriptional regulator [Maledivibacter halophilus]|uniref:DNA-binding transcriptional regulator, MerR family n=1 Tax=Maledivibacter halophilus TaxID=36842 RepID=A0A1T5KZQ2_9FIRM|nr:MerR family transcriptional regulator [Maledivibacter halophilus]SKC69130.1 DNA-binding transcriptional regulator, MerR family [Maledivibacter halophilus]